MTNLGKRLTALEGITEQARRREIRATIAALPEASDLTPAEMDEAIAEYLRVERMVVGWRRDNLTTREIIRRLAAESGGSAEAFEAECLAELGAS